jgi:hypothetical protein
MTLHAALAASALAASAYLLVSSPARLWPAIALIGAGVEVGLARGWFRLAIPGPTLSLGLGAAIAVPGLVIWWRAAGKGPLTAASILAFIGLLQAGLALALRL